MNLERLLVTFLWLLISFIGFTSQYFVFKRWSGGNVSYFFINSMIVYILVTFYGSISRSPGSPAESWDGQEGQLMRYCKKCERKKPPRAHHCKTCNICVLRMDHHCPFIHNCLGQANHGEFIRFLLAVDLCVGYIFWKLCRRTYDLWSVFDQPVADGSVHVEIAMIIINLLSTFAICVSVGLLTVYQLWNLCGNYTTIEAWEKERHEALAENGDVRRVEFPYDVGVYRNICSIMGDNPVKWLLPGTSPSGDGLSFLVNGFSNDEWPPEDPNRVAFQPSRETWTYGRPPTEDIDGFRQRQRLDKMKHGLEIEIEIESESESEWKNIDGERLEDFGVDTEADIRG